MCDGLWSAKTSCTLKKWRKENWKAWYFAIIGSPQLRNDHSMCVHIYTHIHTYTCIFHHWYCLCHSTLKVHTHIAMEVMKNNVELFVQSMSSNKRGKRDGKNLEKQNWRWTPKHRLYEEKKISALFLHEGFHFTGLQCLKFHQLKNKLRKNILYARENKTKTKHTGIFKSSYLWRVEWWKILPYSIQWW